MRFKSVFPALSILAFVFCAAFVVNPPVLGGQEGAGDANLLAALPPETPELEEHRRLFARATRALAQGDRRTFLQLKATLASYPLATYLDYADFSVRIPQLPREDVDEFLNRHQGSVFASTLRQRWLKHLADRKLWPEYIRYYDGEIASAELACHYSYALYRQGEKEKAIARAIDLWRVGKSQPNACDPIFTVLMEEKRIGNDLAWQRYSDAVFNHQYSLARYVERFFTDPDIRQQAKLYLDVDQNPRNIGNYTHFNRHTPEERRIITHGITHLARIDASLALKHWNRYHQTHEFDTDQESEIISVLVKSLYQAGYRDAADQYLLQSATKAPSELLEWRLRELIKDADWAGIITWSAAIDKTFGNEARWQYWRARALELTSGGSTDEIKNLYLAVAPERSFYGFLASEWLNVPYEMQHEPVNPSPQELQALAGSAPFLRIRELYHHGELVWARREWQQALKDAPEQQWLVAAKLAELWQWHNQAIMTMIQVSYWNDIDVRFPQPHRDAFLSQAKATDIPANLLLAISRQESAFNPTVTSPAGAKGLMQVMPGTARDTARKHNISYNQPSELFDPEKNILIGSKYYRDMLNRFNNNRILATAAYNAGPGRIDSWRKRSAGTLPFDAWIETIPFLETRNYVKNVLAFSIIYAHHLGLDVPILSPEEKNTLL